MPPDERDRDPRIALAVVTRDRAELFESCLLPSLRVAAETHPVVVVDQSTGDDTRRLVESIPGVRYLTSGPGLSCGRNVAIAATTAPLLALTDDDVSFSAGWLDAIADAFDEVPEAGAVCGRGRTPQGQFLPGRRPGVYRWPTRPFGLGSGLNLALRRSALDRVGPFDEQLGAGGTFRAGEDSDMLYRVLRAGYAVVCRDDITVTHHDWRTNAQLVRLAYSYGYGAGAQTAKHVAHSDRAAAVMAIQEVVVHGAWLGRNIAKTAAREVVLQGAYVGGLTAGYLRRRRALRDGD